MLIGAQSRHSTCPKSLSMPTKLMLGGMKVYPCALWSRRAKHYILQGNAHALSATCRRLRSADWPAALQKEGYLQGLPSRL